TSAPLAEAKATPAGFYERRYAPEGLPVLVVSVPGAQRLTIGCIEPSPKLLPRNAWRFWWYGTVRRKRILVPCFGRRLADARREIRLGVTTGRQYADAAPGIAEFNLRVRTAAAVLTAEVREAFSSAGDRLPSLLRGLPGRVADRGCRPAPVVSLNRSGGRRDRCR